MDGWEEDVLAKARGADGLVEVCNKGHDPGVVSGVTKPKGRRC